MKKFFGNYIDSIRYALSDRTGLIVVGILMALTSLVNKDGLIRPIWKLTTVTVLIVMGYGSFVSWYTLKGSDDHPKIRKIKKMTWEGFKKTLITVIYSLFLAAAYYLGKITYSKGHVILAVLCIAVFILIYLCLIGGLLNRYLNHGKFLKAFNIPEIIDLISLFDVKSFLKVIIAVIISQVFAITVVLGFSDGFSMIELLFSIATFFLAPFLYIANKRFIGLNVRKMLEKNNIKRE